jgi:signal peptidase I
MEDTLLIGDHILVRVFPPIHPKRGDIVVFHYPLDRRQTFVKRVIGIPGDRIRIASKVVYRNAVALHEPYAVHKGSGIDPYGDNFPAPFNTLHLSSEKVLQAAKDMLDHHVKNGELVVPPGKYFVLGDNRDNSLDSRYWGFLDHSDIIGEPFLIYESEATSTDPAGPPRHVRVRWNRIFKVIR